MSQSKNSVVFNGTSAHEGYFLPGCVVIICIKLCIIRGYLTYSGTLTLKCMRVLMRIYNENITIMTDPELKDLAQSCYKDGGD
jgi:hypothetical protein